MTLVSCLPFDLLLFSNKARPVELLTEDGIEEEALAHYDGDVTRVLNVVQMVVVCRGAKEAATFCRQLKAHPQVCDGIPILTTYDTHGARCQCDGTAFSVFFNSLFESFACLGQQKDDRKKSLEEPRTYIYIYI